MVTNIRFLLDARWRTASCRTMLHVISSSAAVLIVLMFASDAAQASCGDYLYKNGKPVGHHSGMTQEYTPLADFDSSSEAPLLPLHRCSGPNCSGDPLPFTPAPAVPTQLTQGSDQATIAELVRACLSARSGCQIPESERGARFEPSTIFRPPIG